jgi:hypothetical protein
MTRAAHLPREANGEWVDDGEAPPWHKAEDGASLPSFTFGHPRRLGRRCLNGQVVVSEVSSIRKLVAAEESSTPTNFTVTVAPMYALRLNVRWT